MKALITIIGIILLAGGSVLFYDGYQTKQSAGAYIEKQVSTLVETLTNDQVVSKGTVNKESDRKMAGGGIAAIGGIVLVFVGIRRKKAGRKTWTMN